MLPIGFFEVVEVKFDLYDRERVRNIYIALCVVIFFTLILLADSGYSGWVTDFIIGFGGGSIFSYMTFCLRHRLPFLGGATFAACELIAPLTLLVLSCVVVAGVLWTSASGGKPTVITGVLLSHPLFQVTYEAWWDKKQESDLKREISISVDKKISSAIATLRKEYTQERKRGDRESSESL